MKLKHVVNGRMFIILPSAPGVKVCSAPVYIKLRSGVAEMKGYHVGMEFEAWPKDENTPLDPETEVIELKWLEV